MVLEFYVCEKRYTPISRRLSWAGRVPFSYSGNYTYKFSIPVLILKFCVHDWIHVFYKMVIVWRTSWGRLAQLCLDAIIETMLLWIVECWSRIRRLVWFWYSSDSSEIMARSIHEFFPVRNLALEKEKVGNNLILISLISLAISLFSAQPKNYSSQWEIWFQKKKR